ncbi:uncharacterized protein LOC134842782 [Symsagittifera roscoffensis]|uniref:uncharacterized protein LOC134842782 n=1 Tax=Symsagittifera roscoffensis TaxID=84072 RepID=UPI00307C1FEF
MSYRSAYSSSYRSGGSSGNSNSRGSYGDRYGDRSNYGDRRNDAGAGAGLRGPKWSTRSLSSFQKDFYQESPLTASRHQEEVDGFLQAHQLQMEGSFIPRPIQSFDELVVPDYLKMPIRKNGFTKPTPIQAQSWPVALKGKDLVGVAQTGSGKTYAFVVPAILHIKNQPPLQRGDGPIALILCPTRELSQQVAQVAQEFTETSGVRNTCVYGGSPKGPQIGALDRGCELVIATPGRLLDFMESKQIRLDRTTYLVLDEADRMLDMGFEPQIKKIIEFIRPDRQTLMFSATWPKEVHNLAGSFMTDYSKINVGDLGLHANHNIVQVVDVCEEYQKEGKLIRLLEEIMRSQQNKTIIFTETKRKADELTGAMRRDGWPSLCIHGDKKQAEREWVLEDFKAGRTPILVATDVAARGLDISDVRYVINFDYPGSSEDYVHRIGRTARSDNSGTAYTFFTQKNFHKAADLIKVLEEANQTVPPPLRAVQHYSKPGRDRRSGGRDGGGRGGGGDRDRDSRGDRPSAMSRHSSSSHSRPSGPPPSHGHHYPNHSSASGGGGRGGGGGYGGYRGPANRTSAPVPPPGPPPSHRPQPPIYHHNPPPPAPQNVGGYYGGGPPPQSSHQSFPPAHPPATHSYYPAPPPAQKYAPTASYGSY